MERFWTIRARTIFEDFRLCIFRHDEQAMPLCILFEKGIALDGKEAPRTFWNIQTGCINFINPYYISQLS